MTERKKLDREVIEEAFRIMGQYLLDRKALGEIAIYGGTMPGCSAVIMGWSLERPQKPLCSLNYHDPGSAKASPCTPARVKRQVIELVGTYPSPERSGLRVVAAKPSYMLAMKLSALERSTADDRDFADGVQLGIACGVKHGG